MNLIDQYSTALDVQAALQKEEFDQHTAMPIADRVLKGHSMINLIVDFEFYDGAPDAYCQPLPEGCAYIRAAHVHTWGNLSGFREGSSVWLSRGQYRFKMEVVQDSVRHFVLQPNAYERAQSVMNTSDVQRVGWQVDEAENSATYQMLKTVADFLKANPDTERRISQVLDGAYRPAHGAIDALPDCQGLNPSQQEAVSKSLATDYIHLIQGPPGTGKTHTIARLCQQLVARGCCVMVSGPTHTAINNCLDHTARLLQDPSKVVKLGERYQASEILQNPHITRKTRLRVSDYKSSLELSQDGIVIGATPYALCYPKSRKLDGWIFDYAVVDEASQMSIPMAVAVMSKCRRIIFVGDHQQLSPIIPADTGNDMFACSIFRFLADRYPEALTLLDVSYRLNAQLLEVPNRLFYHGRLHSEVPVAKPFAQFHCYGSHASLLAGEESALLFLHDEFDGIGHSPYEAGVVADLVADLLGNGVPLSQIGILTPYRAQVRMVRKSVYERGILDERKVEELFVDTVDRMQGQERDYIIYTLANCNPLEQEDRLEFIYDYHRLNVAVTRARIKTIVIANNKYFSVAEQLLDQDPSPQLKSDLEACVGFFRQMPHHQFDPFDDAAIWL